MTKYESSVLMMQNLSEADLLVKNDFVKRLYSKTVARDERFNPYKHLTRKEIIDRLTIARKNAQEGHVMEAHHVSNNIREKYGL